MRYCTYKEFATQEEADRFAAEQRANPTYEGNPEWTCDLFESSIELFESSIEAMESADQSDLEAPDEQVGGQVGE